MTTITNVKKNIFKYNMKELYSCQTILNNGYVLACKYSPSGTVRLYINGQPTIYTAGGGGYDKAGACIGNYIQDTYQDLLLANLDKVKDLYGLFVRAVKDDRGQRVSLDGACGIESMREILRALDLLATF